MIGASAPIILSGELKLERRLPCARRHTANGAYFAVAVSSEQLVWRTPGNVPGL